MELSTQKLQERGSTVSNQADSEFAALTATPAELLNSRATVDNNLEPLALK
jgi:hypothetical protein